MDGTPCPYCKVGRLRVSEEGLTGDQAKVEKSAEAKTSEKISEDLSGHGGDAVRVSDPNFVENFPASVDTVITAERATKKVVRILRRDYPTLKLYRHPCADCHLMCLLAHSSEVVLNDLEAEGKSVAVVCNECAVARGIDPLSGGITEEGVKEIAGAVMRRSVEQEHKN